MENEDIQFFGFSEERGWPPPCLRRPKQFDWRIYFLRRPNPRLARAFQLFLAPEAPPPPLPSPRSSEPRLHQPPLRPPPHPPPPPPTICFPREFGPRFPLFATQSLSFAVFAVDNQLRRSSRSVDFSVDPLLHPSSSFSSSSSHPLAPSSSDRLSLLILLANRRQPTPSTFSFVLILLVIVLLSSSSRTLLL